MVTEGIYSGSEILKINDKITLPDGRYVFLDTNDDTLDTDLFVSDPDFSNIERLGQFCEWPDAGGILGPHGKRIHVYPEGEQYPDEPTSDYLRHYSAPVDDLLNVTDHGRAIDVSAFDWHTGDPEVTRLGGTYILFLDRAVSHPNYRIGYYWSDDLYNWHLGSDQITTQVGGDISVLAEGGMLHGLTEFSTGSNIGYWRIYPHNETPEYRAKSSRDLYWEFQVDSRDGLVENDGGGSFAFAPSAATYQAKADGGSGTWASSEKLYRSAGNTSWRVPRTLCVGCNTQNVNEFVGAFSGEISNSDKTTPHIGFAYDSGDLVGHVADGSAVTKTTLVSSPNDIHRIIEVNYQPGESVSFRANGDPQGEITNGLPDPTTSTNADKIFKMYAETSSADDARIAVDNARVWQAGTWS